MNMKPILKTVLTVSALCLAFSAIAQTNVTIVDTNAPTGTVIYTDADRKVAETISKFSYWKFMLAPLTVVLVAALKKWAGFIPDKILPWTAPLIGGILDWAASKFGFWTGDAAAGATMGGLAVWFHQAFWVQPQQPNETKVAPTVNVFFLAAALCIPTFSGCTIFRPVERTPEAKRFDTYKSVYALAREAYKSFKRECYQGRVTANNEAKGDTAWNEFRKEYELAFKIGNDNTPADAHFIALKDNLVRLFLTL